LRPFDDGFGPTAPRAAARLLTQANRWHGAAHAPGTTSGNFDFASVQGQPPPRYPWAMVMRSLPRFGAVTLAIYVMILAATFSNDWTDEQQWLGPVAVTWALAIFVAYPSVRRGNLSTLSRPTPLAPANRPACSMRNRGRNRTAAASD
jgi:hypothetical protein